MAGGKANTFDNDLLKLILNGTSIAGIADNAASVPLTQFLYVAAHGRPRRWRQSDQQRGDLYGLRQAGSSEVKLGLHGVWHGGDADSGSGFSDRDCWHRDGDTLRSWHAIHGERQDTLPWADHAKSLGHDWCSAAAHDGHDHHRGVEVCDVLDIR